MPPKIENVVVLMLENRSFDHMLGFLDHPDPAYPGITNESNPDASGAEIMATPTATASIRFTTSGNPQRNALSK